MNPSGGGIGPSDEGTRVEDVHFAITQFSYWINNADMKAGLLATATTLLAAALVSQKKSIVATFPLNCWTNWLSLVLLCLSGTLLILTVVGLFLTLRPRRATDGFSRYSWVSVASTDSRQLERLTPRLSQRSEALRTSKILADITKKKLNSLAFAALCWLLAGFSTLGWYIFLPE